MATLVQRLNRRVKIGLLIFLSFRTVNQINDMSGHGKSSMVRRIPTHTGVEGTLADHLANITATNLIYSFSAFTKVFFRERILSNVSALSEPLQQICIYYCTKVIQITFEHQSKIARLVSFNVLIFLSFKSLSEAL